MQKTVAGVMVVLGMALPGASTLLAQDGRWNDRDAYYDRRDLREDVRDIRHDYARVDRLRDAIAADRWRLDQDARAGRYWAAERDRRDLARDEAALRAQIRDIQRDRADIHHDRRDLDRDSWR